MIISSYVIEFFKNTKEVISEIWQHEGAPSYLPLKLQQIEQL